MQSMQFADESSLYATVTGAARFLFEGGSFSAEERAGLANWILAHQNRQRGFIFHPTFDEMATGIRLLSGERPRTRLLAANAVELETLRLLALLQPEADRVQRIFQEADARLAPLCFASVCTTGECAHASIAVLRYRMARDTVSAASSFSQALDALKADRRGDGRWRRFPFFFTLLWLVELPADLARDELSYAAPACARVIGRSRPAGEPASAVRETILCRAIRG
ncbi:MAG: hypothetical protein FJZ89_05420 [Chloroflexi bacterium]|nr:hypothetical protein [Chloroflexota bacterium]